MNIDQIIAFSKSIEKEICQKYYKKIKTFIWSFVILALIFNYLFEDTSCTNKSEAMQMKSEYGLFTGCMLILDNDRKIPLESYVEVKY